MMDEHERWLGQIGADLEGELSLPEQAALARHLAACPHCAGARASHLELRAAIARSAGQPQARVAPRPALGARALAFWATLALVAGVALGWAVRARWELPGGAAADTRAAIVVP